jgi:hypothetical protein
MTATLSGARHLTALAAGTGTLLAEVPGCGRHVVDVRQGTERSADIDRHNKVVESAS